MSSRLPQGDFIPLSFFNLFPPGGWFALSQVLNTGLVIFGSASFSLMIDPVPETFKFLNIALTKRSLPFLIRLVSVEFIQGGSLDWIVLERIGRIESNPILTTDSIREVFSS